MSIRGTYSNLGGIADIGATASNGFLGQWDDLQGPVSQAGGVTALTFEQYRNTPFFAYHMRHDQDDTLYYTFQLKHAWKRGTDAHLHVHYTPLATWTPGAPIKYVGWEVSHFWTTSGLEVPVATSWTTTLVQMPVYPTDQFKLLLFELIDFAPPETAKESSLVLIRIRRLGTTGITDTYTDNKTGGTVAANLVVWDFDMHIQLDKPGTVTEYPV